MSIDALSAAAESLCHDFRRSLASDVSERLTATVREIVPSMDGAFSPEFAAVSGSTCRNTHLPQSPDFDIGLWPTCSDEDWPSVKQDYTTKLREFCKSVADAILSDRELIRDVSLLCEGKRGQRGQDRAVTMELIKDSFKSEPSIKHWNSKTGKDIPLITAKYKVNDHSILEVSVGTYRWHRIGLRYNEFWMGWINSRPCDARSRIIGDICLLKFLANAYGCYGRAVDGLSSRSCEHLIIPPYRDGQNSPFIALMEQVARATDGTELRAVFPLKPERFPDLELDNPGVLKKLRLTSNNGELTRCVINHEKKPAWTNLKRLACDVLEGPTEVIIKTWRETAET
jgi:hypothetical protein